MGLILLALSPIVMVGAWYMNKATVVSQAEMEKAYARAGAIASESIAGLRTVASFNGEKLQTERYAERLEEARDAGSLPVIGPAPMHAASQPLPD